MRGPLHQRIRRSGPTRGVSAWAQSTPAYSPSSLPPVAAKRPLVLRPLLVLPRALLAAALVALAGCTHAHALRTSTPEGRAEVNDEAAHALTAQRGRLGPTAVVVLRDGREVRTRGLHLAADLATWTEPYTLAVGSAPTSDVVSVRFTDRRRGLLEGSGLGLVLGAGTGAALGALYGSDDDGWFSVTPKNGAAGGAVVFGVAGLVAGAVRGWSRGSWSVYVRPPSEAPGP